MSQAYSPMMRQYLEIKDAYPDAIILFRLGDFYELFFDDAKVAARELDLYLTGKDAGGPERVPMCGVPHHAVNNYVARLIAKGYKVAIAEQVEEAGPGKKLVKREVTKLLTPGTIVETGLKDEENNYIAAIEESFIEYTICYADITTGEIYLMSLNRDHHTLAGELDSLGVKEVVVASSFDAATREVLERGRSYLFSINDDLNAEAISKKLLARVNDYHQKLALTRLVGYLVANQKQKLEYLRPPRIITPTQYLAIDNQTVVNLELVSSACEGPDSSLFGVVNKCKSAIGSRLLRRWLLRPLNDRLRLVQRLDAVELFRSNFQLRQEVSSLLNDVYDLERIFGRVGLSVAGARDLLQLKKTLVAGIKIASLLENAEVPLLTTLIPEVNALGRLASLIEAALVETPPPTLREGGLIREGYSKELDKLRLVGSGSKDFLTELEERERQRTGIKNLKIGYNKIYGFYLEVTKSNLADVKPEYNYIRIQTLTGAERYKTEELKEREEEILSAESRIVEFEYQLFMTLREAAFKEIDRGQEMAEFLATVDVIWNFAMISLDLNLVRPEFNTDGFIDVVEGRHLVVEKYSKTKYVVNDWSMDNEETILMISGPNMGGKSTYMRQQALIVVLAQVGCYVPATSCNLPVFNKIFTRIGASDNIVAGQSTFMVEMMEANNALRGADENSLVIFDEIGRGTSTYDGMALAQAIIEQIASVNRCKTLFSTHYHALTMALDGKGIKNIHVRVHQEEHDIVFLYKIAPGAANRSYGINVARLANLPTPVLNRAQQLLDFFESQSHQEVVNQPAFVAPPQVEEHPLIKQIREIKVDELSPLEALSLLYKIKEKA